MANAEARKDLRGFAKEWTVFFFYDGNQSNPPAFQNFTSIEAADSDTRIRNYTDLLQANSDLYPKGQLTDLSEDLYGAFFRSVRPLIWNLEPVLTISSDCYRDVAIALY